MRRGEGRIDSPVQISSIALGGNRRQEGANIERTSARSLLRPLSVMHDAMLLTLYAHRNNPIFLPRFRLHHLRLVVSPYRPRGPRPALALSLSPTRPWLFISIYFDHRIPHLYPSASSRPATTRTGLAVYLITAQNDFASPPCELRRRLRRCIHVIVIEK